MYLPWEFAHARVHWQFYYQEQGLNTPVIVWILCIAPQLVVLTYFISCGLSGGSQALYDKWTSIKIVS